MAKKSNLSLEITPNYEKMGEFGKITVKLCYNGKFQARGKHNEYIGGSVGYFDFVDLDKLGLIELWGFAEEIGFKERYSLKFWHKFGGKTGKVRCLETDEDVLNIRNHIPEKYEIEIYLEHLEASSLELRGPEISGSEFLENEILQSRNTPKSSSVMNHNVNSTKGKNVVDERKVSNEFVQDDEDDFSEDGFRNVNDPDDEERQEYLTFDPKKESVIPDLKLVLIFNSKQEAKFAIKTYCINQGKTVNFVKNEKIRLWEQCRYDGYTWMIHVARMSSDSYWQVRT